MTTDTAVGLRWQLKFAMNSKYENEKYLVLGHCRYYNKILQKYFLFISSTL